MEKFDLIVIGGGPAGYVAAIRAAQLGFNTACVEKRTTLGGTCLNVGCIPSKALLESSEKFYEARTSFAKHGIITNEVKLDLAAMMKRKDAVVRQLTTGISGLLKKNKITSIVGTGRLSGKEGVDYKVEVSGGTEGARTLSAPRILLATGSEPAELPFLKFDGKKVISSTEALSLTEVPKHLVVIGGGVIGLEMGSVWARLGSKVTVVEYSNELLALMDQTVALELKKALIKQGIEFRLGAKCLGAQPSGAIMLVEVENLADQSKSTLEADVVLVSVGRKPYTTGLGLESVGLVTDKMGRMEVDAHYQTQVPGIFAVGDLIAGPMLAHKAEEEGIAAVEIMADQAGHVNYEAIPNVIYTHPELASVGYTEAELKAKGVAFKVGMFPFMANGRAKAMEATEGLVKIIADATTDRVLGVHICGPRAGDMIAEAVTVIEYGGSAEDVARTSHAHPSVAEVMKEAALAVDKRQIHL